MKNTLLILSFITILTLACKAQQPVAKLSSNKVNVGEESYTIQKSTTSLTKVVNDNNKLTNVKEIAPNLTPDIKMPGFMDFDKKILSQICASAITLEALKKFPKEDASDFLYIFIKVNPKGDVIECEFLLKNNSLITISQIKEIEHNIKEKFKVKFKYGIEKSFEGANYFLLNAPIPYRDMLKIKEGK